MKHTLLLLFFIFSSFCYSQEICNNGVDDDGDGKIDLNDSDCVCNNSKITSIIPNPSFEEFNTCPNSISQLNFASSWQQATLPTTDYFNTCGYVNNAGLTPFPDGNAAVGAFFAPNWQEYLGACLTNPMKAGTSYQLTFNIASKPATGSVDLGNGGVIDYGPIDIVIYGKADCVGFPLMTNGCPSAWDSSWIILGTANYTPVGEWGVMNITFTPNIDINSVILGSPCTLPPEYQPINDHSPYFYFDNLLLNTSASFGISISQNGNFCDNNLILTAVISKPVSTKKTFQWYHNGISISGATSETYKVPSFATNLGKYSVKITDEGDCIVSRDITINNTIPGPKAETIQPNCKVLTGTISIQTPASKYSFDNGLSWQDSPSKNLLPVGVYYLKIKTLSGCISAATGVSIVQPQLLANSEFSVVQPTTCDGKGSITINSSNAAEYSFDDGFTWTLNSKAENLEPGNYLIKIKDAAGCQSSSQYVSINRIFLKDPTLSVIQPKCGKGGEISISTPASEFSFDDGKTWTTDNVAKDLQPGTYLVKIKNSTGCQSNSAYINLETFYLKTYPTYTRTQPICGTGGTITITSEASEYSFDGGKTWTTNPVAENLLPGYYSIIFKNELGCMSYAQNVNLDYYYLPNPSYTYTKPTCETGGSITITTIAKEYSFDNGVTWSTNPTASNLKPGTYYIMIKNEIGCTSSTYQYVNLDYFFLPDPGYIAVNPSCGNIGSIEITTKADFYSFDGGYNWTTDPKKTNLTSGSYYIKIKNKLGCESNNVSIYLDSSNLTNPNYNLTQAACNKNASITITTKADFYSFDNGNTWTTNPTLSDLQPNNYYYIKIKNNIGCTSYSLQIYIKPFYLENPLFTVVQPTCGNGGSINITTPSNFYSFDNGSTWTTNPTISNLSPNNYYYIKIKNSAGCMSESQYVYIQPFFLDNPNYTVAQPKCGTPGNITIKTKSDFYSFDNGSTWTTNPILSNPTPNTYYSLLIKNDLGCVSNSVVGVFIEPFYLDNPAFIIDQPTCGKGGTISITTVSDQYSFDGGNTWTTNPVVTNLTPAYYYIVIKNKLGCVSNSQYAYIQPFYLDNPTYDVIQPTCEKKGSISITTKADQYSFDNGFTWTTDPVLTNPTSTYYYIKIKNNAGCESNTQYAYIDSPPYIASKPTVTTIKPTNCGTKDGSITVTTYAALYSFDNGVTWETNSKSGNLEAGTYKVRIRENSYSCPSEATPVILNSTSTLPAPLFSVVHPTCSTNTGSITITTAGAQYSFDNGLTWQTKNSKNNLPSGDYLIKIKNDKGCISDAATAKINPLASFIVESYSSEQPLCIGASVNGITIKIVTPASEYSFDNGLTWTTNPIATNLKENTEYCLKIKNAGGCISEPSCMTTIKQIPIPQAPKLTINQPADCTAATGSITVNTAKGQYSFDDGKTWTKNQTSISLTPGTYFVRTKEERSECISEATKAIINNPPDGPKTPETIVTQPITCANPFGSIQITSLETEYSFDNGNTWTTDPITKKLAVGTYYVKAKNTAGCQSNSVTIKIKAPTDYPNAPTTRLIQPDCSNPKGNITITSGTAEYSFDNGVTWVTSNISNFLEPGDYFIKIKNSNGCISEGTKVTIVPFTNFPAFPAASKDQTFCVDQNATIADINIQGTAITWYDSATTKITLPETSLLQNDVTYYATQTISGCESKRFAVTIKIEKTLPPTGDANQPFCSGQNPTIADILVTGNLVKWYDAISNGTLLPTTTNLQNGKTYYASQTVNNCEGERFAVTVSVKNTPFAPLELNHRAFCKNENATLNDIQIDGQNLKWYSSNIAAGTLPNSTLLENNMTYYVSQTTGCEGDRTPILVKVNDTNLPTAKTEQSFCIDQNATIGDINIQGTAIVWYDAAISGNILAETTLLQNQTYYATQTLNSCESNRLAISIKIQDTQKPIANSPQTFCIQKNAKLSNIDIKGENIKWFESISSSTTLSESTLLQNGITYYASQTLNNCESDRIPVSIKILEATTVDCINFVDELPYPKFFTPNNDGYNDTWTINFDYLAPNTGIRIFDRYGKFIKELFNNGIWDGNYLDQEQPASDYWFTVTRLNGTEYRGHFSLKR